MQSKLVLTIKFLLLLLVCTVQIVTAEETTTGDTVTATSTGLTDYGALINNTSITNKNNILTAYTNLSTLINNIFLGTAVLNTSALQSAYTNYQNSITSLGIPITLIPAPIIIVYGVPLGLNDQLNVIGASSLQKKLAAQFANATNNPLKISITIPPSQTQFQTIVVTSISYPQPSYFTTIQSAIKNHSSPLIQQLKNINRLICVNANIKSNYSSPGERIYNTLDASGYKQEMIKLGCPNNIIPIPLYSTSNSNPPTTGGRYHNSPIITSDSINGRGLFTDLPTQIIIDLPFSKYDSPLSKDWNYSADKKVLSQDPGLKDITVTYKNIDYGSRLKNASSINKFLILSAYNTLSSLLSSSMQVTSTQIINAYQNYQALLTQLKIPACFIPVPQLTINGAIKTTIASQISSKPGPAIDNAQAVISKLTPLFGDSTNAPLSITFTTATATALQQLWGITPITTTK